MTTPTNEGGVVLPQRRGDLTRPGMCCCHLINHATGMERSCRGTTTGPDDPFCEACTPRHPDRADLVAQGIMTITARMPERRS